MTSSLEDAVTKSNPHVKGHTLRSIEKVVSAMPTSDGAGVRLNRSLGTPLLDMLDPFLMLDEFRSDNPTDYIRGFPDHPHRGFETVTYMLAGYMNHKDNRGNQGELGPGSVQWMTAGRGIIHSEMPRQENGLMWGFQLWVNLPARDKMKEPHYQDIDASLIPEVSLENGGQIRVIAGNVQGVEGAVKGVVADPLYLDIALPLKGHIEQAVPADLNAFVYVFEGEVNVGSGDGQKVSRGELGVLTSGSLFQAGTGQQASRFLLIAGKPVRETVVKHGPFVMNSEDEIRQAIRDYQSGEFG